jgi:membrane-associated phospholipid phosphatase
LGSVETAADALRTATWLAAAASAAFSRHAARRSRPAQSGQDAQDPGDGLVSTYCNAVNSSVSWDRPWMQACAANSKYERAAMDLDTRIFYAVNHLARDTPWLHAVVSGYASYGTALFAVLMLAAWWIARREANPARMAAAVWTPLGVLIALAVNQPIADTVGETRPCNALHDIVVLHCNTDAGFPSDHAVMAGAATVGMWLVSRSLGVLAALAAAVMAFARVYVGAHYPQDVLAGFVLGAVVGLGGYALVRPLLRWLLTVVARTPLRLLILPAGAEPVTIVSRQQ